MKKVVLSGKASKALSKMNEPSKSRIKNALLKLAQEPPQGDIKALSGRDGYRMRIGQYRILFDSTEEAVVVYDIGPRGQVYKGGE